MQFSTATLKGTFFDLIKPLIDNLNGVLTKLLPNGQIYLVIIGAGLIAYYIKNKYNWGKIAFLITTFVIYGFFRWLTIGG